MPRPCWPPTRSWPAPAAMPTGPTGRAAARPDPPGRRSWPADGREWGFANGAGAFRAELWRERPFREDLPGCEDKEWALHWLDRGYGCLIDPALAVDARPHPRPAASDLPPRPSRGLGLRRLHRPRAAEPAALARSGGCDHAAAYSPQPRRAPGCSHAGRARAGCSGDHAGAAPSARRRARAHRPATLRARRAAAPPARRWPGRTEALVGGVLQQPAHEIGHSGHEIPDRAVGAHAQARHRERVLELVAEAAQDLQLEVARQRRR